MLNWHPTPQTLDITLTCRVFGSGFLAQQGSLASCEVVVEQSKAQDYSGQQVEVFQV